MTPALARPRAGAGWAAVVVANAVLGVVGALAVMLWLATADGVGQRAGWTHPDPTLFDDGLEPWVLLALVATAVDLALVLLVNAVLRRLLPAPSGRRRRLVAVAVHVAVAVAVAVAVGWLAR